MLGVQAIRHWMFLGLMVEHALEEFEAIPGFQADVIESTTVSKRYRLVR
jgi:hypothetical protein